MQTTTLLPTGSTALTFKLGKQINRDLFFKHVNQADGFPYMLWYSKTSEETKKWKKSFQKVGLSIETVYAYIFVKADDEYFADEIYLAEIDAVYFDKNGQIYKNYADKLPLDIYPEEFLQKGNYVFKFKNMHRIDPDHFTEHKYVLKDGGKIFDDEAYMQTGMSCCLLELK